MYCIRCGKLNMPEATFCYNCGARLVRGPESAENNPALGETTPPKEDATTTDSTVEEARPSSVAAVQETPPPSSPNPTSAPSQPNWPNNYSPPGMNGSGQSQPPGWNPPSYGSYPPPGTNRVPLGPQGLPLPVYGNPEGYYSYTNKDGKKVYAALAPLGVRFGAMVIDILVAYLPISLFVSLIYAFTLPPGEAERLAGSADMAEVQANIPSWVNLLIGTLFLLYVVLMHWLYKGRTIGKRVLGLKVIKLDGSRLDFNTVLLRSVFGYSTTLGAVLAPYGPLFLLNLFLEIMVFVGFASAIWDKRNRGWHDKLADTIVVRSDELVQGINF
jgi:uncharacterized RDD family membrane protein YckC